VGGGIVAGCVWKTGPWSTWPPSDNQDYCPVPIGNDAYEYDTYTKNGRCHVYYFAIQSILEICDRVW
jgi:hypothetical protein